MRGGSLKVVDRKEPHQAFLGQPPNLDAPPLWATSSRGHQQNWGRDEVTGVRRKAGDIARDYRRQRPLRTHLGPSSRL